MSVSKASDHSEKRVPLVPREIWVPFALLTSCFALWGLANNMTDVLLATFKRIMSMTDFQTSWIQIAFYGSYFCLALPAALFIRRFSYKAGVLLGLGMFAVGGMLFYPASQTMQYSHFLTALFILAGGLSILETSANPYVIAMGPEQTATRRLNFAQSFNPIGSILGVVVGKVFILSNLNVASDEDRLLMSAADLQSIQQDELNAVMGPYVTIALLIAVVWIVIAVMRFPHGREQALQIGLGKTFRQLLSTRHYVAGVVTQFFYVGAQIGVWSFTIRYVMENLPLGEAEAADYYLASIVVFSVFRFICTELMKFFSPRRMLFAFAIAGGALTLVVMFTRGPVGVYALVAISACMSLMFPTIYGLSLRGLGEATKVGASGLIMAIIGGAVFTAVQGLVSDLTSIYFSFFVPLVCFVVIAWFARSWCEPVHSTTSAE